MTEHLPECPVEKMLRSGRTVGSQSCICEHLRACEERVIKSANLQYFTSEREAMTQMDRSWNTALDHAMNEVARLIPKPGAYEEHYLKAIKSLKRSQA